MEDRYNIMGCASCDISEWDVLTDGIDFEVICRKCGRRHKFEASNLKTKPDMWSKPIPLRFLT